MKRNLSLWQFSGFCLTCLGGTLLHFLYDWTNESLFIAPISAVNESTAEHMKLLYFPWFVFALVQSRFFSEYNNFWCIKLLGIITGLTLIPVLFYTYNGVIGKSPDWINIAIFFISAGAAFLVEWWLFKRGRANCNKPKLSFAIICIIGVLFMIFTFLPPKIALFADPLT